jgi:hypothetical protein
LKFGEFAEFRDSNKENESVDHLGCFFVIFPDRRQVRDLRDGHQTIQRQPSRVTALQ